MLVYMKLFLSPTSGLTTSGATILKMLNPWQHIFNFGGHLFSIKFTIILPSFMFPLWGSLELQQSSESPIQSPGTQFGKQIWGILKSFSKSSSFTSRPYSEFFWMVLGGLTCMVDLSFIGDMGYGWI